MGDASSKSVINNRKRRHWKPVPPKYDLIVEDEGNLKVMEINAVNTIEAKKIAYSRNKKIKGVVFSDDNFDSDKDN